MSLPSTSFPFLSFLHSISRRIKNGEAFFLSSFPPSSFRLPSISNKASKRERGGKSQWNKKKVPFFGWEIRRNCEDLHNCIFFALILFFLSYGFTRKKCILRNPLGIFLFSGTPNKSWPILFSFHSHWGPCFPKKIFRSHLQSFPTSTWDLQLLFPEILTPSTFSQHFLCVICSVRILSNCPDVQRSPLFYVREKL